MNATEIEATETQASATEEFVFSRTFAADRVLVWQANTEAAALEKWWGPKGSEIEVVQFDLRVGGVFLYKMTMPDGGEMWGKFIYQEIVAPEKMVYISSFSDANGGTTRAPFSEKFPLEIHNTRTLEEHNGQTTLTLRGGPLNATEDERAFFASMHDSMRDGFSGTADKLVTYLEAS